MFPRVAGVINHRGHGEHGERFGGIGIAAASFCAGDFMPQGRNRIKATPFIFFKDKNAGTNQELNANIMSEWETFCDISYYHLWRVRRKTERGFNDGFHLQHGEEAKALVELLNQLERERAEAREVLRQIWQSGDAFLPHVDQETTNRWRKAAGWEETK